ncbi:MAG: Nudix family hydrolase [Burkholderiales bacterium]
MKARGGTDASEEADQIVEVAAGVVQRDDGSFLLASRPSDKPYAGYWEFPGGKLETGESARDALVRELAEELGIEAHVVYPWLCRIYAYKHATVRIRFLRVRRWSGELCPQEGQAISWQWPDFLTVSPMLPANTPILKALSLPSEYAISNAHEIGVTPALAKLDIALARGLRLVQIRERDLDQTARTRFAAEVVKRTHRAGGRVVVSGSEELATAVGADGVHLTAVQLMVAQRRPALPWCGASCHDEAELRRAEELGMDFAVLGPVCRTDSHPAVVPMGWERFTRLAENRSIPVYALGGLGRQDLEQAWSCGAHGVSMMRGAWHADA